MNKTFNPTILYALIKPVIFLILIGLLLTFKYYISFLFAQYFNIDSRTYIDILIILLFVIYTYAVFYTYTIKYVLTNEQLTFSKGIFSINVNFLELYRIKDVKLYKSFLMRLINVYSLTLYTSDRTHPIFIIDGIGIKELPEELRTLVEINRKTKGVYEID